MAETPEVNTEVNTITAEVGEVNELESVCMECGENGITRLMFTQIPFFREVIVSSFECGSESCGEKNTEVKFGGTMQPTGVELDLKVRGKSDLDRELVKSEFCVCSIPDLEFEVPAKQGLMSTVEGIINQAVVGLESDQPVRRAMHPEVAEQIDAFIKKLQNLLSAETPFTFKLWDPSGNSFIQSANPGQADADLQVTNFHRTLEHDKLLCLVADDATEVHPGTAKAGSDPVVAPDAEYNTRRTDDEEKDLEQASLGYELEEECYACKRTGRMKVAVVDIPHFHQTVIMAFKCDCCGFASNEVKSGGAVGEFGKKITLQVRNTLDLSRDLLKSHTCYVRIPELDFELSEGSLGSMFSTVEGLVSQMLGQLTDVQKAGFLLGDSAVSEDKQRFVEMLANLEECKDGKRPFTLVLDDPLAHSYIQAITDDPKDDEQMSIETYTRTAEQDDELGLSNLRETEKAYEQPAASAE